MSSAFTDAVMAQMTASLDPSHGMVRDYMSSTINRLDLETAKLKASAISEIGALHAKAVEDSAPAAVIAAYDRLLVSVSA